MLTVVDELRECGQLRQDGGLRKSESLLMVGGLWRISGMGCDRTLALVIGKTDIYVSVREATYPYAALRIHTRRTNRSCHKMLASCIWDV